MVASTTIQADHSSLFDKLLGAVKRHGWQTVASFQQWEGDKPNAEVYQLKCSDGRLSMVVVYAPFLLEEPYALMHQEDLGDAPGFVPASASMWHPL